MSNMAESVQFAGAFPVSQNEMDDWSASTVPDLNLTLQIGQ